MSGEGDRKVKLKSSDDEIFEVDKLVAFQSQTLKDLVENIGVEVTIPLPNVTSEVLTKIIEYSKYHTELKKSGEKAIIPEDEVKKWDEEFANVDLPALINITLAANYLNIAPLLNLVTQVIADVYIKGKTPEEISRSFKIENDFTREEEAEVQRENQWENQWAFE